MVFLPWPGSPDSRRARPSAAGSASPASSAMFFLMFFWLRDHPRPAARRLGPRRVRASLVRRHRYRLDRAVRHLVPPPHRGL